VGVRAEAHVAAAVVTNLFRNRHFG